MSGRPESDPEALSPDPPPEPVAESPEQIEALRAKAAKSDEHWERLLRLTADLDNYRKRAAREKQDAIKYANEGLLTRLIPSLDSLEMALAAAESADGASADSLRTGVTMIYNQIRGALADAGLEEIDAANQPFDPNLHEAVSQEVSATVPEGRVLRQLRRGYRLKDRLLRPATVVVAKGAGG